MAAPYPFHVAHPARPRLARKLRRLLGRLIRRRPDLVPVVKLRSGRRGIVVMDEDDCVFLRRP